MGTDFGRWDGLQSGTLVAFRFMDFVEVGAGARYLLTAIPGGPGQPDSYGHGVLGAFHLGLHLDLDARRRVAIPLGVQLGRGGPVRFQGRFLLGLRVRVVGPFYLGIYPLNPAVSLYRDDRPQVAASAWTFRTSLEVGVAF